jgi:integrase
VKTFLASLAGDRLQAVMLLSLIGLRPAEVCGLRWDDIDLAAATIAAGREAQAAAARSRRRGSAGVPDVAGPTRSKPPVRRTRKAVTYSSTRSGPCRTDWLRRRAYKLMDAAKVRRVRLYDARHSCLSFLRMAGVPGPIVSAWAGHADLSMADRVYVHPNTEDLEQGRDALTKLLG